MTAFAALALAALTTAQTYYIDPTNGTDVPGAGAAGTPFRSMTFAASQATGGPLTLRLQPGLYSANSGEAFPLTLPENVTVEGLLPSGVRISHEIPGLAFSLATPALTVDLSTTGSVANFKNLLFRGNQQGLRIRSVAGTGHTAVVENVRTQLLGPPSKNSGIGIRVITLNGSQLRYTEDHRHSSDATMGTFVTARDNSIFVGELLGCENTSAPQATALPSATGYRLDGEDRSEVSLTASNCTFYKRVRGIETRTFDLAVVDLSFAHCAFHDCGVIAVVDPIGIVVVGGGVVEEFGAVNSCTVQACAFFENKSDLPDYLAATYSVSSSLVQDPGLVALPGNITGDPLWVDAANGDFHLLPGSICLDAVAAVVGLDSDGDDRTSSCASSGDIGPDESFPADHYVAGGNNVSIDTMMTLHLYGDGGSLAVVATGAPTGVVCGAPIDPTTALQLAPTHIMPGSAGTREHDTITIIVPNNPTLLGQLLPIGVGFVTNPGGIPGLQTSPNLRTVTFCP